MTRARPPRPGTPQGRGRAARPSRRRRRPPGGCRRSARRAAPPGPTRPMNAEGKSPKRAASSAKRCTEVLYQSSARSRRRAGPGRAARIWSRVSASRARRPLRARPNRGGCVCHRGIRSPAGRAVGGRRHRGPAGIGPEHRTGAGRPVRRRSRRGDRARTGSASSAWDCTTLARFRTRRRSTAVGGGSDS